MKRAYFTMIVLLIYLMTGQTQAQPTECQKVKKLVDLLDKYHYRPRILDDDFSKEVFDNTIESLDESGLYFTEADLKNIEKFRLGLDDEIKSAQCAFISELTALYLKKLQGLESMVLNLTKQKLDFSPADSVTIFGEGGTSYSADEVALKRRWNRWLKYQALLLMDEDLPEDTKAKAKGKVISDSLEAAIRKRVTDKAICKIQRSLNPGMGLEKFIFRQYLNVIAQRYDPHTAYFSSDDKQDFEASLSRETGTFGLDLDENTQGEIQVSHLTPGGAAWRSNKLHQGDVLLEVQFEQQEKTDLTCMDSGDLMEVLEKPGNQKITLKVKKSDGKTESVTLFKEKLESDENLIKSFVLKGVQKIGYIALPGFYTEWDQSSGMGCADDIAREIIKLKKEGIRGLILDLRYNGGGSMNEALDLAGIFVEEGPLLLHKNRDEEPGLLKDKNRGTLFDEPLVIMINRFSASASEILAGALRDYNRALIVGENSYGKASGQVIIPLEPKENSNSEKPGVFANSQDFVKVTVSRYYHLDGKSHQLSGIAPDILLPDMIGTGQYGEKQLPNHLPADSVVKKVYFSPLAILPKVALSEKNALRNAKNPRFMEIEKLSLQLAEIHQKGIRLPLNFTVFQGEFLDAMNIYHKADELTEGDSTVYEVENHQFDKELIQFTPYKKELNDYLKKDIKKDIYIQETFYIINDLIKIQNK